MSLPLRARRLGVVALALALAAGAGALLGPAPASARPASPIKLDRWPIEPHGKITDMLVDDLDGDGRKDVILVMGREVRVYFQRDTGAFPPEADQRFRLDPRAAIFDLGDVSGTGKKDLVFIREDGVFSYQLEPPETPDRKPFFNLARKKLFSAATILRQPGEEEARRKEFLRDVDGDGKLDVIVPERAGFGIYRGLGGRKFAERQSLPAPPTSVVFLGTDAVSSQLTASYFFPNPNVADWDADGHPDLVLALESAIQVWKTDAAGKIARAPAFRTDVPGVKSFTWDAERPFELDFTMPLVLRDLNRDGRVDAALTHVGSGTTRVFLNGPNPTEAFKTPARVVRAKGVTFLAFFVDVDGDGLDDMVLPRMDKIGIWSILKAVVTRSVPIEAQFFYQRAARPGASAADKDGVFPEEPDFTRTFDIPISIHAKGEGLDVGTSLIASLDGDFDGDGIKDLIYRTDSTTLSVYTGQPGRKGLSEDPAAQIEIPSTDDYRFVLPWVDDLNGDHKADVLLRYMSWDRKEDKVEVFVSRP